MPHEPLAASFRLPQGLDDNPGSNKIQDRADDKRLILSDDVAIESEDGHHVVLVNLEMATRVRISARLLEFVRSFSEPRVLTDVVSRDVLERIQPQVALLLKKHILLDADAPQHERSLRQLNNVAYRFCNAPSFSLATPTDFVVIGLPCDFISDGDSREGPETLRRKSLDFPFRRAVADNIPCGWFDADVERWILEGATIADAGDVHIECGEPRGSLFKRVGGVLERCCHLGAVPVLLGGDAVATEAAMSIVGRSEEITVVRVPDFGVDVQRSSGRNVYLSIDLSIAAVVFGSPATIATEVLTSLCSLKAKISALGAANRIVAIDVVGLDVRSAGARLGAALGCQLALTAMDAAHVRY